MNPKKSRLVNPMNRADISAATFLLIDAKATPSQIKSITQALLAFRPRELK